MCVFERFFSYLSIFSSLLSSLSLCGFNGETTMTPTKRKTRRRRENKLKFHVLIIYFQFVTFILRFDKVRYEQIYIETIFACQKLHDTRRSSFCLLIETSFFLFKPQYWCFKMSVAHRSTTNGSKKKWFSFFFFTPYLL